MTDFDRELREAERALDTDLFLELQERGGSWREIPEPERTIRGHDGGPLVVEPGVEVPWTAAIGTALLLCLDIRRSGNGDVEFGLAGPRGLPIVTWAPPWRLAMGWGGVAPEFGRWLSRKAIYDRGKADGAALRPAEDLTRAYLEGYEAGLAGRPYPRRDRRGPEDPGSES